MKYDGPVPTTIFEDNKQNYESVNPYVTVRPSSINHEVDNITKNLD